MARQDTERRLAASLAAVRTRIFAAAARAGRDPTSVRLVAVTKGQPPDVVRAAYHAGQRDFGENRVEEALPKQAALADLDGVQWHMIGHIQSRKARLVPPAFTLVHSLDRPKIAGLLDRYAGESGRRLPVLLECNVSGEATKEGWQLADRTQWADRRAEIADVLALGSLKVMGLMTMAPLTQDPGVMRAVFRTLRQLRDDLADNLPGTWSELSMGMTDDFEVAIEEGATLVRIGRAIFGPRSG
jgi:pyridoxal phosphate enzyme (YggS family)